MDTLLDFIEQIGHYALFLVLCLGLVGLPVPNEVVAMTGGALAASEILTPVPSFIMTFLGVCSGSTVGYMLSRFTASKLLNRVGEKSKIRQFLDVSERLTRQYGNYAICISAFAHSAQRHSLCGWHEGDAVSQICGVFVFRVLCMDHRLFLFGHVCRRSGRRSYWSPD